MRKHERDKEVTRQHQRKINRLSRFEVFEDNECVTLTHLPALHFAEVQGVPGLSGRRILTPPGFSLTLVLFKWVKSGGRFHRFSRHHHKERLVLTPHAGHIQLWLEGEDKVIGDGDSQIIGEGAMHEMEPLNECLFTAAFEPPLPHDDPHEPNGS